MRLFGKKSRGSLELIEAVDAHIEKFVGEVDLVLDEKESPTIHVDVHITLANSERPHHTLITSGMAEKPMRAPKEMPEARYAELMLCLPAYWPIDPDAFRDEENWWPIRLLKGMARYPHDNETWFYAGHTVLWNDPPKAFAANTEMAAAMLLRPRTIATEAHTIELPGGELAHLWALLPLYKEELSLKLDRGADHLEELFIQQGINEILNPKRINVAHLSKGASH